MISNVTKGLAVAGLMLSGSAMASGLTPAAPITIDDIVYNGSGCPIGTVAESISEDNQAFTLTFSDYIAEVSPYTSLRDGRKNCQLTVTLNVPQGWQFSIASFDYRGFAFFDEGVQGRVSTSYYFQGNRPTGTVSRVQDGFFDGDFSFNDEVLISSLVWSPCGVQRALNVNTAISVRNMDRYNNPWAEGVIGTDSIDGSITQVFGISWRQCDEDQY